ncbi:hypothetical protein M432DRAFT_591802 [Thermoascus aurantiacus ATCC 26904]
MRPHQLTVLLAFLFLGYLATADAGIDRDDVKRRECWDVCRPIVKWSIDCDIEYGDSDPAELNCVCSRANAATLIPLCEACISTYDDDGHHNDAHELLTSCSYTTTTWNSASATSILSAIATATTTATGQTTATGPSAAAVSTVSNAAQPTGGVLAVFTPPAGILAMMLAAFLWL